MTEKFQRYPDKYTTVMRHKTIKNESFFTLK